VIHNDYSINEPENSVPNFQFFVHKTSGFIPNINSAPLNLPEAGFYSLEKSEKYAESMRDGRNFIAIYDCAGDLIFRLSA